MTTFLCEVCGTENPLHSPSVDTTADTLRVQPAKKFCADLYERENGRMMKRGDPEEARAVMKKSFPAKYRQLELFEQAQATKAVVSIVDGDD